MRKNRRLLAAVLGGLLTQLPAQAQMGLTFDWSQLGNPNLNGDNVYITFAADTAQLTLGTNSGYTPTTLTFTNKAINIDGTDYGTSQAYSLNDIAAMGMTIDYASSLSGFISYGSSANIAELGVGVQPGIVGNSTRWSQFEVSYGNVPSVSGFQSGADLTNITQFGGSLKMEIFNGTTSQGYVGNTLSTGDMFRALAAASGNSVNAVETSGGKYVRAIGPNFYPASIAGSDVQNPYPTFNAALQSLNTAHGTGNVVPGTITNLAPGQSPGGTGAVGTTATASSGNIVSGNTYDMDYHFDAEVTQVEAPSASAPNGTYTVTLTGYVNATGFNGAGNTGTVETTQFTALTITIAADDIEAGNLYMTNFIYQEAMTGNGISTGTSGWDQLVTLFGSGFVSSALQEKAAGDFAQGMLTGMIGSTVLVNGSEFLGDQSSYEWWTEFSQLAYALAQSEEFYSLWANVIYSSSPGEGTPGEPGAFDYGSVYGSPYDDRFNIQLLGPDEDTTEMKITLLPDGDLNVVPEPGTAAMVLAGTALLGLRRRRAA